MNWDPVVADIGPRIYKYFCGSFSREAADDLTQEVLLRLVQKYDRGEFDPGQGSLVMFAFGIAKLVRLEAWRDLPPAHGLEPPSGPAFPNEAQFSHFRQCLHQLTEIQRHIVLLLIDQELSLFEIAQLTSLPLNTVKSHMHRAKETLRKLMIAEGVDYG